MNKPIRLTTVMLTLILGCHSILIAQNRSALEIIELSQKRHDPHGAWESAKLEIHIQEPRPQTPFRYSILFLDNTSGEFKLTRSVDEGLVDRIITPTGEAKVLLNGKNGLSEELIEKYRLGPERISGFRLFYQTLYGLPMSLNSKNIESLQREDDDVFQNREVSSIRITLKESVISKDMILYISKEDYSLVGLKFDHPDSSDRQDELIYFDGEIAINQMVIPRFRHWYNESSKAYLGSDVIVKTF